MSILWHAVNRNDFRPRERQCEFRRFDRAHISFRFHEQVLTNCPAVRTKAIIYTYPAVLFENILDESGRPSPGRSRTWRDSGNFFESVGNFSERALPWLRDSSGSIIYDIPSASGYRVWFDLTQVDMTPFIEDIRARMESVYRIERIGDEHILSLLHSLGQPSLQWDTGRNGVVDDEDLLFLTMRYGQPVSTQPFVGYLENYVEGFMIDNFPEWISYTGRAGLTTEQQIKGYAIYCDALRTVLPHALLFANIYEGASFRKVGGTDSAPVFAEPAESMLQQLDGVLFENWRWHWAARTGGRLAPERIAAIEQRIEWLLARGKRVILAVNLAYDEQGYQERLEAVEYALERWGCEQVRFGEFRQLYPDPAYSVVEASRERANNLCRK